MSPREVFEIAGSELDQLGQELISCNATRTQPLTTIESITERLIPLRQERASVLDSRLRANMEDILTKAKRVQALLEAGMAFHCHSMFGKAEVPETYSSDGTFSATQDCRIVFQG
jgi:hypothetical protein